MRGVFWALAVLILTTGGAWAATADFARADSSNLAGGVLIAHHPAAMVYSVDTPAEGWCGNYLNNFAITATNQQVNRIDETTNGVFWFVLAAWKAGESKKFCGAEFGLGAYTAEAFVVVGSGACGTGALEIPGDGWPGPGSGVAIAVPELSPFRGNYVPIYYFAGYAYAPGTLIPLTNNPATGLGGMANCATPSVQFAPDCFGKMGILQDGLRCDPPDVIAGACCGVGGACQLVADQTTCEGLGGTWDGGGTCDPSPCPITWACCIHDEATGVETCLNLTQTECLQGGGLWHESSDCAVFTCPLIRACCIETSCTLLTQDVCLNTFSGTWVTTAFSCTSPNGCAIPCCLPNEGGCLLTNQVNCAALSGEFHPEFTTCEEAHCPLTPVTPSTWGSIKAIYR
jgi:hypothetical protein